MTDEEVIRSFPAVSAPVEPGYAIDFLGTKTRASFLPKNAIPLHGIVEGHPIPANFHATQCEWGGALRAALDAEGSLTVIELGAGWGPWMVSLGRAAQLRGITDIRFVGVEADEEHHKWIGEHFRDNGFDVSKHTMILGIAGPEDGFAHFPVIDEPSENWGAQAVFEDKPASAFQKLVKVATRAMKRVPAPKMRRVKSVSIKTLLAPFRYVDLLHIDIQGAEADTLAAALDAVTEKVRRIVVGTHGRQIEDRIMNDLSTNGWILENEESCQYIQHAGKMHLSRDGCQTWRNPRFDDPAILRRAKMPV